MTKREACERIVQDGSCTNVGCRSCPLWGEWNCLGKDEVALARAWLEVHPVECGREEIGMTEREACERIVRDGHCAGVDCSVCPLFDGEWDCADMDVVTLAKMWLRLHLAPESKTSEKDNCL